MTPTLRIKPVTEVTALSELLKQYGPLGFSLILMALGLVYLLRWLRNEQDRAEAERKEAHDKFANSLEKQGQRHEVIIKDTVSQFTQALDKQGQRIDKLEDRMRGK